MDKGRSEDCPLTKALPDLRDACVRTYLEDPFVRDMVRAWSKMLGRGGSRWPRLQHLREFCLAGGIRKVGLGVCSGFLAEARFVKRYLGQDNIEAVIAACKIGAISVKEARLEANVSSEYVMCNPVGQVRLFNSLQTELNVQMGLCLAHDMIFSRLSDAPVTTLFVKEHLSGHTPYATLRQLMKEQP